MGTRLWADVFESGELSDTSKYQSFKPNRNIALRAVRTWVVMYGDATFTSLNMKIYGSDTQAVGPSLLLHTSTDSRTKAEMFTEDHGFKEIYFTFNDVSLNANTTYYFVLNGVGYTYGASSYLAWRRAFPDPVYRSGLTLSLEKLPDYPYAISVVGAEF